MTLEKLESRSGVDPDVRALSARPTIQVDGVWVFVYLQLLDLLTTVIGFEVGLAELSPAIQLMMTAGPVAGVVISKGVALGLGAICIALRRRRIILWINYWFAALVVWNLALILSQLEA